MDDSRPLYCNKGFFVSKSSCMPCPDKHYQPRNLFEGTSCKFWTQKATNGNWEIIKDGTDTSDIVWGCKRGYKVHNVSLTLQECVPDITTKAPVTTEGTTTPKPSDNTTASTQAPTTTFFFPGEGHEGFPVWAVVVLAFVCVITAVLIVIYFLRRKGYIGKIKDIFCRRKISDAEDPEEKNDLVDRVMTVVSDTTNTFVTEIPLMNPCDDGDTFSEKESSNFDGSVTSPPISDPITSPDHMPSNISKQFCFTLAPMLEDKLHNFIHILDDPSKKFDSKQELLHLKLEGKNFLDCGIDAFWLWALHNKESDHRALIAEALSIINEPELLDLSETKCNRKLVSVSVEISTNKLKGDGEPSYLLYRLFYRLTQLMDDDKMLSFVNQLPNDSVSFDSHRSLKEANRNTGYDMTTACSGTLMEWRKKNRHLNLRAAFLETLLGIEQKFVTEDENYIEVMKRLCPVEDDCSDTAVFPSSGVEQSEALTDTGSLSTAENEGRNNSVTDSNEMKMNPQQISLQKDNEGKGDEPI